MPVCLQKALGTMATWKATLPLMDIFAWGWKNKTWLNYVLFSTFHGCSPTKQEHENMNSEKKNEKITHSAQIVDDSRVTALIFFSANNMCLPLNNACQGSFQVNYGWKRASWPMARLQRVIHEITASKITSIRKATTRIFPISMAKSFLGCHWNYDN